MYPAKVGRIQDYGSTRVLRLHVQIEQADVPFRYEAGQWVDFMIPGLETVGGYSIISSTISCCNEIVDNATLPAFDLAVKKSSHPVATWIHSQHCRVNAEISIRVGGNCTLELLGRRHYCNIAEGNSSDRPSLPPDTTPPRQVVLIAGGIGINPLYSMLLELSAVHYITDKRQDPPPTPALDPPLPLTPFSSSHLSCLLIWSVRSLEDASFLLPQLVQLSRRANHLRVVLTLTLMEDECPMREEVVQHSAGEDKWGKIIVHKGRISTALLYDHLEKNRLDVVGDRTMSRSAFVCGPPGMITAATAMLTSGELDMRQENVYTEWWY